MKLKYHQQTITWIVISSIFSFLLLTNPKKKESEEKRDGNERQFYWFFINPFCFIFIFYFSSCFVFFLGFSPRWWQRKLSKVLCVFFSESFASLKLIFSTHSIFNLLSGRKENLSKTLHIHKTVKFFSFPVDCLKILERLHFMQIQHRDDVLMTKDSGAFDTREQSETIEWKFLLYYGQFSATSMS